MKKIFVYILLSVTMVSCFKKKEVVIAKEIKKFSNTCEPNQLWLNEYLIKEVGAEAHSGTHACVITDKDEFGLGMITTLAEAANNKVPKKVLINMWVKTSKIPLNATFVYSIDSDKNLFWDGQPLKEMVKEPNKWTYIQFEKDLPVITNNNSSIKTYLLNAQKDNFMVDDLNITYEGE